MTILQRVFAISAVVIICGLLPYCVLCEEVNPPAFPAAIRNELSQTAGFEADDLVLDAALGRLSSAVEPLPFQLVLNQNPLSAPDVVYQLANTIAGTSDEIDTCFLNLSILIDRRIGIDPYVWPEKTPEISEFMEAYEGLFQIQNLVLSDSERQKARSAFESMPDWLKVFLHAFLKRIAEFDPWMQLGRDSIAEIMSLDAIEAAQRESGAEPATIRALQRIIQESDLVSIFYASGAMLRFFDAFRKECKISDVSEGITPLLLSTPYGDVIVSGGKDDVHDYEQSPLLILDCGGDDTYQGAYARADSASAYSFVIDMGGADVYQSLSPDAQAVSSLCGCSALFDLGDEDDRYTGSRKCFGYAFAGVSLLYDANGKSAYEVEAQGLGSGEMGIAMIADGGGEDRYRCVSLGMGYGGLGGAGFLFDASGNDYYIASATPVIHPSTQLPEQNMSACLGAGSGRLGDGSDGHLFPGGLGILIDPMGNDSYEASVLGMGAGYGHGIGILADLLGNDHYRASWYVLGAAAHKASGLFVDASGDDEYEVTHYMACGAATDLSLGVFWERDGSDAYHAKNASMGYGLFNGAGIFADSRGDDHYILEDGLGLGRVRYEQMKSLRVFWPTIGIFSDMGGDDSYSVEYAMNDSSWPDRVSEQSTIEDDQRPKLIQIGYDVNNEAKDGM